MNWNRISFYLIVSLVLLLIDFYAWQSIKLLSSNNNQTVRRIIGAIYWSITVGTFITFFASQLTDFSKWPQNFKTYLIAAIVILYLSKLVMVLFLFMDDIFRFFRWIWEKLFDHTAQDSNTSIGRIKFFSQLGSILGGTLLVIFLYGMIRNAYNYQLLKVKITLPNLPDAFNGLRIVQISDIHTGSFTTKHPIHKAVEMVNAQNADYIFFTGDLVNEQSDEALPYIDIFKKVKSKHGVFSILGNHDYGDYRNWNTPQDKIDNMTLLESIHEQLGWQLLRNKNVMIGEKGNQIAVIGIDNWSSSLRFPKYGKMAEACIGTEEAKVKLLLSHDPSHWDSEVTTEYKNVDVTFSGHTHGMQFGIEIPGFIKWSPVSLVYPHWAGLYNQENQYLYVNRGLGFLGYPGRVGILPEITLIELVKG